MLTCFPEGICSWDFRVSGAAGGPAALQFNFFAEQGGISLGRNRYEVRKHGVLSGRWTLEQGGEAVAEARKPDPFLRSFELRMGASRFTARAQSPITRCYDILAGGHPAGFIRTAHPFTRRATIECARTVPELIQLFAFWLAVITWRRAARNRSGGATS